jgi:hypothetical protein
MAGHSEISSVNGLSIPNVLDKVFRRAEQLCGHMCNNVSFRYPAEFVRLSSEDGILAVEGAGWFVELLQKVPDLEIDRRLCQEDWGVVVFARRNKKKFWIGLSMWPEGEHAWLVHFHHASFSWHQKLSASGKAELERLVGDFHKVLVDLETVSEITWYLESEMSGANPRTFSTPVSGQKQKYLFDNSK